MRPLPVILFPWSSRLQTRACAPRLSKNIKDIGLVFLPAESVYFTLGQSLL